MKILKVRLMQSFPELPKGIYDAIKLKEGYKIFANTGWWLVNEKYITADQCDFDIKTNI
jgi:hypothetical protein